MKSPKFPFDPARTPDGGLVTCRKGDQAVSAPVGYAVMRYAPSRPESTTCLKVCESGNTRSNPRRAEDAGKDVGELVLTPAT
jgi:hypothetical protein